MCQRQYRIDTAVLGLIPVFFACGANTEPANQNEVPNGDNIVIYAAGDICDDDADRVAQGCKKTSDIIVEDPTTNFVLSLGDLAYEDGTLQEFNTWYDPTWGRFKGVTYPILGNHEANDSAGEFAGYFSYWGTDGSRTQKPGMPTEGFYSFDLGPHWHLVALNTIEWSLTQRDWLIADLAANVRPCILVFGHHPRYSPGKYGQNGSSGTPDNMEEVFGLLVDAKVDLYLASHDHLYARFAKQDTLENAKTDGTAHFLVGTGGKNMQPIENPDSENMEASFTAENAPTGDGPYGVLKLSLQPTSYDFEFIVTDGTYSDRGSAVCNVR